MADKDDENEKDPKSRAVCSNPNSQRGTKTVKQILSEITEGSIVVEIAATTPCIIPTT
jgi:hypothetical protein